MRRLRRRLSQFVRTLFGSGRGEGGSDDLEGGVGVREPRRPLTPSLSGAATVEPREEDEAV